MEKIKNFAHLMVESGVDKMKEAQRRPGRGQKGV